MALPPLPLSDCCPDADLVLVGLGLDVAVTTDVTDGDWDKTSQDVKIGAVKPSMVTYSTPVE